MPKQKVRFAVGGPSEPRSAVWSLLWREHDAYVTAVEAGGVAKVSLHLAIGEFSWGYTRDFFEANRSSLPPTKNRDFERWKRPADFAPGLTLPLRIYVANEALREDPELPTSKAIRWVKPQSGKAVGFVFVIASLSLPENPYAGTDELELLARAVLTSRSEAILLYSHQHDAVAVSKAANNSIIEFTKAFPHAKLPSRHRMYTQTDIPEPGTGSRNLIEIPTYVLPAAG